MGNYYFKTTFTFPPTMKFAPVIALLLATSTSAITLESLMRMRGDDKPAEAKNVTIEAKAKSFAQPPADAPKCKEGDKECAKKQGLAQDDKATTAANATADAKPKSFSQDDKATAAANA